MSIKYKIFLPLNNAAKVILMSLVIPFYDISPDGHGKKTNVQISPELNLSEQTIESLKKRFVEGGTAKALQRKPKTINPKEIKFDGAFEARLVALVCSEPPLGRVRWTVRFLADRLVELGIAAMEDILEVYHRPFNLDKPVICMDESNKKLVSGSRDSLPVASGKSLRVDDEYVRHGVADIFMAMEPIAGQRFVY